MRELIPAWPPGACFSTTIVRSPSEAPYTAAASPRQIEHNVQRLLPAGPGHRFFVVASSTCHTLALRSLKRRWSISSVPSSKCRLPR